MNNSSTLANQEFCKSLSRISAVFALVIGSMVLVGWILDIAVLKSIIPNFVSMNPVTAICFILLGAALLIHCSWKNTLGYTVATVCSLLALLTALSRLVAIFFGFNVNPDQLLFAAKLGSNHMAPNTAFDFLLLSTAFLTLRYPKNLLRYILIILAIMVSFMALVGYAYDIHALYQITLFISMALNTAFTFFVLSCGMLCFEPDYGFLRILTDEGISGVMSRQLLPQSIIALVGLGWLRLLGQRQGVYSSEVGVLVFLFAVMVVFIALIWQNAVVLGRIDIERQQKAKELRESEGRLNLALDSAQMGAWDLDLIKDKAIRSLRHDQIFGYSRLQPEWSTKIFFKHLFPADQEIARQSFAEAMTTGDFKLESRIVWPDQSIHWITAYGQVYRNENGDPIRMLGVVMDNTTIKNIESGLAKLSQAVEQSPVMVMITDTKGLIEHVNPAFERISGYTLKEVRGKNPRMLKSGQQSEEFYQNLWETINSGDIWKGEFHNKKKSGEVYWETASISSIRDRSGAVTHFVAVKEDITLRKEAEQKLVEAMNIKSEFTSMVSHELRTPLTVIKECVTVVFDETTGPINANQKKFLDSAKRNVDRLGRLINDVLDYQKLELNHMEFLMEEQSINEMVQEIGDGFKTVLNNKGMELQLQLQADLPKINFDKDKVTQVLTNLIHNASKFSNQGTILLSTEMQGKNTIKVSVKDQGIGIKPEDLDKLFKSFSQISTGIGRKTGGTGLGLVLCKKIIEQHNGKMGVDSVFGQGSTFYFILPIQDRRIGR